MATMAGTLYAALVGDDAVKALVGDPARLYDSGSLGRNGVPADPPCPYMMYKQGETTSDVATRTTSPGTGVSSYTFFFYDEPGSFARIREVQQEVRRVVESLNGTTTEQGMIVTEARWTSSGSDSYDPVSKKNVKTQTFRVVGRV